VTAREARQISRLLRILYSVERAAAVDDISEMLRLLDAVDPTETWNHACTLDVAAAIGDQLTLENPPANPHGRLVAVGAEPPAERVPRATAAPSDSGHADGTPGAVGPHTTPKP